MSKKVSKIVIVQDAHDNVILCKLHYENGDITSNDDGELILSDDCCVKLYHTLGTESNL